MSASSTAPSAVTSSSSSSSSSPPAAPPPSSAVPLLSQRYRRLPGEPALAFFERERNSLCAYPREVAVPEGTDPLEVERLEDEATEAALLRLERKLEMTTSLQRDAELKGPPRITYQRHEVPTQTRQRQQRQRIKAEKGRKLMAILKFLLRFKAK